MTTMTGDELVSLDVTDLLWSEVAADTGGSMFRDHELVDSTNPGSSGGCGGCCCVSGGCNVP